MKKKAEQNAAFGRVIRQIRKRRGLTQEGLAFKSGVDRTYISLLELGSCSPTLDTIVLLCQALEVSLSSLFALVEEEPRLP